MVCLAGLANSHSNDPRGSERLGRSVKEQPAKYEFRLARNLKPQLSVHARQPHPTTMKPIACDDSAVAFGNAADLKAAPKVCNFLDALFNLLNESAIRYCVLRAPAPVAAAGSEILELAVHPEHRRELATLFYGLARERFRPVQRLNVAHGTDQFHFALLDGSRPLLVRVDVHYPGRCVLLSAVEDDFLVRSQWKGKYWMAAPADQFSYLLAKAAQLGAVTSAEEES